ncbi:Dixin [Araneus ventricosus]|uniref:Dixin n=1 Tax=Araneus ventricosus TaxID=182803 RepID=A0A4Y2C396_ARAVE|nr:Dixin [Araneus ventricosus]
MTSSSWQEWTARLRAYVGWLNSQLRKEEGGVRKVSDLRNDLRDGVILAHLVASLGNDIVPGINTNPRTEAQAKENVDRLFRFLIRKGVPIHSLTPKEICDGDLKAIMRLVHAVASHYKPDTVLNPPRPIQRKEETRSVRKSCKVSPLQNPSNLTPQRLNSKSEPSSLNAGFLMSESFIEQLLLDIREAKQQLILLQETTQGLGIGKISQVGRGDRGSHGTSWKNKLKWRSMRSERKTCTDPPNENLQDENVKLKKIIEEKEQEISKLKVRCMKTYLKKMNILHSLEFLHSLNFPKLTGIYGGNFQPMVRVLEVCIINIQYWEVKEEQNVSPSFKITF